MEVETEIAISSLWRSLKRQMKSGNGIISEIPYYLKYMLYRCGYGSVFSILSDPNLAKSLEDCMKHFLDHLKEDIAINKKDPEKYLGPYAKIDTFALLPGHKALLRGLIQGINKKETEGVTHQKDIRKKNMGSKQACLGDMSSENRLLEKSLRSFMMKNNLFVMPHFKILSHDIGDNGEMTSWPIAQVFCPKCSKRITLTRDRKRARWTISNLTSHFQQHYQNPFKTNQSDKLCSETGTIGGPSKN